MTSHRVVQHQAADVAETEPAVALEVALGVVGGHVRALVGADIVRRDLVDVADVERAVVREVQVQLAPILLQAFVHGEHLVQVRQPTDPLRGADPSPEHVDVLFRDLSGTKRGDVGQEEAKVGVHRIGGVGGVPHADQMALLRPVARAHD